MRPFCGHRRREKIASQESFTLICKPFSDARSIRRSRPDPDRPDHQSSASAASIAATNFLTVVFVAGSFEIETSKQYEQGVASRCRNRDRRELRVELPSHRSAFVQYLAWLCVCERVVVLGLEVASRRRTPQCDARLEP